MQWKDCASDDGSMTSYYADDKADEVDVVRSHAFNTLTPTRQSTPSYSKEKSESGKRN